MRELKYTLPASHFGQCQYFGVTQGAVVVALPPGHAGAEPEYGGTPVAPCCGAATSLHDLDYDWPAGFARFVLQAREPALAGWLDDAAVARLEKALGTRVRQIRTRY